MEANGGGLQPGAEPNSGADYTPGPAGQLRQNREVGRAPVKSPSGYTQVATVELVGSGSVRGNTNGSLWSGLLCRLFLTSLLEGLPRCSTWAHFIEEVMEGQGALAFASFWSGKLTFLKTVKERGTIPSLTAEGH